MNPLQPYMNKRVMSVTLQDLLLVLQHDEVPYTKFSDKTKKALAAMGGEAVFCTLVVS